MAIYQFNNGKHTHEQEDNLRAPGSIGAGGVQRVFKGMRMAGRMGGDRVTVQNLEIVKILSDKNELYIKGAVPGARNGLLMISGEGELKVNKKSDPTPTPAPKEEPAPEAVIEEQVIAPAVAPEVASAETESTK